jgi:hypothetical protein
MPDTFVSLAGNLTDDPEVRFTPTGTQVGSFRLAVTPRVREGEGWKNGDTSYFTVTCWRDLASHAADSLRKGDRAPGHRPAQDPRLGDPRGRAAQRGRGRGRGGQPQPQVGDRHAPACRQDQDQRPVQRRPTPLSPAADRPGRI